MKDDNGNNSLPIKYENPDIPKINGDIPYWDKVREWVGTKKDGKSAMSFWAKRFSSSDSEGLEDFLNDASKFTEIINSVRRTANIFIEERSVNFEDVPSFEVRWFQPSRTSTNTAVENSVDNKYVYVNMDTVNRKTTLKKNWTTEELTDVLISNVLTETALKYTLPAEIEMRMKDSASRSKRLDSRWHLELSIWNLLEKLAAEQLVLDNYPGFSGYMAAERAYYSDDRTFKYCQSKLDSRFSPQEGIFILQWILLHPSPSEKHRLIVSPSLENIFTKAINLASEGISTDSERREFVSKKIVELFWEEFPEDKGGGEDAKGEDAKDEKDGRKDECKGRKSIFKQGENKELKMGWSGELRSPTKKTLTDKKLMDLVLEDDLSSINEKEDTWNGGIIEARPKADFQTLMRDTYLAYVSDFASEIKCLKSRLKIQAEEKRILEHGLKKGRIDEGSLYKFGFTNLGYNDPNVFEREEIKSTANIAFCLLVDESASMASLIKHARKTAIVLANVLKDIPGVRYCILGHTDWTLDEGTEVIRRTPRRGFQNSLFITHYVSPESRGGLENLVGISAKLENIDGHAIKLATRKMFEWFPECDKKFILHLNDGIPSANNYRHELAITHTKLEVMRAKKQGVGFICVGMGEKNEDYYRIYGRKDCVFVEPDKSLNVLGDFVTKVVKDANTL